MDGPIIAATDFSARADRAIDRAIMLGEQLGRKVVLLHALDAKQAEVFDAAGLDKQMRAVLPEGLAGAEKLTFAYPEGPAPTALAHSANAHDASLIVMGPARHNSLRDYLLGTAVDYTLRHCDQPTLIVKARPHRPYAKLLVATDFSEPSQQALLWALETFPEAEIRLFHACHVPFDAWQNAAYVREEVLESCRKGMADFVAELPVSADVRGRLKTHVEITGPFQYARTLAAEYGTDLLVVGSHGECGLRHATVGSVANILMSSTLLDTVVVKARG